MMDSDTPLDCAVFQLSPRRSRCELFVSGNGKTEKIASGFLKPFVTHLKAAEEQAKQAGKSIMLEVERSSNAGSWFKKGTLERFVRFVSTPEVLESASMYDAEMSQLEGARRIYSQGAEGLLSGTLGQDDTNSEAAADITKKELLRAIDVRLVTVKQDLATAFVRASCAGFSVDNISALLHFAEYFGANRLNEACIKFISLCQKCNELIGQQQQSQSLPLNLKSFAHGNIRSSSSSDMSIDEPELDHTGAGKPPSGDGVQFHKPNISQLSQLNSTELLGTSQQAKPIQQHLERVESEEPNPSVSSANEATQQDGGGNFRRLSVQDRINLFESKQKEQSTISRNISTAGVVNRATSGKGDHRRLPSDVSEKSVLRRWSGASDMSIDLNMSNSNSVNDPRESGSGVGSHSFANFQLQIGSKTEETEPIELEDTATSQCWLDTRESTSGTSSSSLLLSQSQCKDFLGDRYCTVDEGRKSSIAKSKPALEKGQCKHYMSTSVSRAENCGLGEQDASRIQQKAFPEISNNDGLRDHAAYHIHSKADENVEISVEEGLPDISLTVSALTEQARWRDQEGLEPETRESLSRADDVGMKDGTKTVQQFRIFGRKTLAEVKTKGPSDSQVRFKASSGLSSENDLLISQSQGRTFPVKVKVARGRSSDASDSHFGSSLVKIKEDGSHQGMNWLQKSSAPEGSVDGIAPSEANHTPPFPLSKSKQTLEIVEPPSACSVELVKSSKGNQELNDELLMKANELEKCFVAHKLRTLSEQTTSSRRSRPADVENNWVPLTEKSHAGALLDQLPKQNTWRETSSGEVEFDANFLLKMVDNEYGNSINQNLDTLSSSNDSRGKLYYKYMQKRDTKLREDWGTNRAQKEAKMKAMCDSLKLTQAEMTSKYSGSANRQSASHNHHRAEKLRSFRNSSALKSKNKAIESVQGEEEDLEELSEQVVNGQDASYDNPFGDNSSERTNSMKLLSSTRHTTVTSSPKLSVKSTKSVSIKRRTQTENPLAGSLPNFSSFRKENAKPSAAVNRVNSQEKTKILPRSKSIIEETKLVKEDKPRRSQSMIKSTASPVELKDLCPPKYDNSDLTPLELSKMQTDAGSINKAQKRGELKPFLRKGKGIGPGSGTSIPKPSMVSEVNKNGEDSEGIVQQEVSTDLVKDEVERSSADRDLEAANCTVDSDSDKPRHSQEYENSDDFGSENVDEQKCLSLAPVSPTFGTSAVNVQESPGESPQSWNLHIHRSYSYAHEASDIDASVDSPVGSPAPWNLQPMNQMMEADAARMRKKWGSAQMPMIVANASQQSRKDVTKGFKRLLKFGRKSRGVESLVNDWVSASTASEGDDDTEDGHDLATRPTDDLRKSRMSNSLSHDGFNEGDIFPEQAQPATFKLREDHLTGGFLKAPRSFFSLSSFRSKESKPR